MSCELKVPVFDGFTIDILTNNLHINVQDIFGSVVKKASVVIDTGTGMVVGKTDKKGCYVGSVNPGIIADLTISKLCLFSYEQKIILLDDAILAGTPDKNLILVVTDTDGNPISGASVTVESDIHNDSGTTDSEGLYKAVNKNDFENTITVTKAGFVDYSVEINSFIKIKCQETGFTVASVIQLEAV